MLLIDQTPNDDYKGYLNETKFNLDAMFFVTAVFVTLLSDVTNIFFN